MSRLVRPSVLLSLLGALVLAACGSQTSSPATIDATALNGRIVAGTAPLIVDVRTPAEYAAGHVPGAVNIPYDQMDARADEIIAHKDKDVVLYCRSGRRSGIAANTLAAKGFTKLALLEGDMPGWERDGFVVER
jgi:phage shock protein E